MREGFLEEGWVGLLERGQEGEIAGGLLEGEHKRGIVGGIAGGGERDKLR